MSPKQMIEEWRKGCSCAPASAPELCQECTRALIEALDKKLNPPSEAAICAAAAKAWGKPYKTVLENLGHTQLHAFLEALHGQ